MADRVAVIGAGSSGIAAAKKLRDHGVAYVCFEAGDRVGGNWVYENSNGMSSSYKSLFINTSRQLMEYADFPMPAHYPDYPHHTQIAKYFDDYVTHFGVKKHIRFGTRVTAAERAEGGGWDVTSDGPDGERTERFRALVVANGHHWDPQLPDLPGHFDGEITHSHHYKLPDPYVDRRVLVVGIGNSGVDIATETSRVSTMTYLSTRRGAHIVPKYIFGKPTDVLGLPLTRLPLPLPVKERIFAATLWLTRGRLTDYGLPKPAHGVLSAHPTISQELLGRIGHGRITVKGDIARLGGDGVVFADGSRERVDAIILATGYRITFPFFDPALISAPDNVLPLYKRVFHPEIDDVFFVGLFQPLGAIMPLAEIQGELVARRLVGAYGLPAREQLRATIAADQAATRKRYYGSPRHTMQVDFEQFRIDLLREISAGATRPATPLVSTATEDAALVTA